MAISKENIKNKEQSVSSKSTDITLIFTIIFLIIFGIIMIYSSSYYASFEKFGNHTNFLKKQLLWSVIGVAVMYLVSIVDYKYICRLWPLFYSSSIVFLILVLFIGDEINGAKRWLDFKIIGFQPSEFTKLAIIITLAMFATRFYKYLNKWRILLLHLLLIIIPTALIGIENMSTAIVVFAIGSAIIFVAMPKVLKALKYLIIPTTVLVGLALLFQDSLKTIFADYRMSRIDIFLNGPWSDPLGGGYQTIQSLYAIGSGGLFGKGLGYSMQKNGFIPEAHNDIIFSIVCEELGLFGACALILLFVLLIWRCMVIASNAKDITGLLIVTGVMAQIAFQVIINIAVVTNSMPATGMPLPFISYGGSSLIFLMFEVGLVLNVARYAK